MGYHSKFLLVGNASYLNRGCEAILRGTVKILRSAFNNCQFVNANFDIRDTPFAPAETDPDVVHHPLPLMRRLTARWVAVQAAERLYPSLGRHLRFRSLQEDISVAKAALSIGGDTYTLDYGVPRVYVNLGRYVLAQHKPLIIWGASIGPFEQRPDFAKVIHEHLRREVTAIFVREERSMSYLKEHGIAAHVYLMPDPAFVMDPERVNGSDLGFDLPEGAIGLNLSPLMAKYVTNGDTGAWQRMATDIARELLRVHDLPVILIPHVTSPHSNDHLFLSCIKAQLPGSMVRILPETLSAAKTKYVISMLSCLIGARTHATIASFSTFVPTVSLAYSVKAWGINEMLFGHTRYVVGPTDITAGTVAKAARRVLEDAADIRDCLSRRMAVISSRAISAGRELQCIVAHD
jgi:polysaccharide pyruvyl transferase WcaK-like protein